MDPMILAALYIVLGITLIAVSITPLKCSDKDPKCVKGNSEHKKVYGFISLITGVGFIIAGGYQFYKNYPANKLPTGNKLPAKFYF